jgi:hypothetical protein
VLPLADVIAPLGTPTSDLQATLLERYGALGVVGLFRSHFSSGGWTGSMAGWVRRKLATAERWLAAERPVIREFAELVVESLQLELRWAMLRDEEDRFR